MGVVCPKCGSDKVSFRREKIAAKSKRGGQSVRIAKGFTVGSGSRKTTYEYRSIGFCKGCGATWDAEQANSSGIGIGGIVFAIIFFPITITYLIAAKSSFSAKWKAILIAALWAFVILAVALGEKSGEPIIVITDSTTKQTEESSATIEKSVAESTEASTEEGSKPQVKIPVIVNIDTGKVHRTTCTKLPDEDKQASFDSIEEAKESGYTDQCGICFK